MTTAGGDRSGALLQGSIHMGAFGCGNNTSPRRKASFVLGTAASGSKTGDGYGALSIHDLHFSLNIASKGQSASH